MQDLEVFKQIPGYKAILKAVLKNQIKSLVQQLAQQTGEESVLLTASLEEGTLTQLGSEFGNVFLEGHDEIKSQFLGFCLKRNQIQKQTKEFQESKPRKSWSSRRKQVTLPTVARRSEPYPVSITTKVIPGSSKVIPGSSKVKSGSTKVKTRTAKIVPGSVNQEILDVDNKHQKIKTEATLSYATLVTDGHIIPDGLPNNVQATEKTLTGQGQEGLNERNTSPKVLIVPSVKSEALSDNEVETSDSPNNLYIDDTYSAMTNSESQSPESTIAVDSENKETDSEHIPREQIAGVTDTIVARQVDEIEDLEQNGHTSANEEVLEDILEGMGQGHGVQGQCQSEIEALEREGHTNSSIDLLQSVTSLKGRATGRKSKLRLFNQNKKPSVQKSLKERKAELENYLNLEATDRPYPCNLCPKRFKERHHLVYHLRTHSGHRPYVCTICGKSFTQSSSLNTHKKLHLKDITCDHCGQIFRKISLLQNHVCKVLEDGNKV